MRIQASRGARDLARDWSIQIGQSFTGTLEQSTTGFPCQDVLFSCSRARARGRLHSNKASVTVHNYVMLVFARVMSGKPPGRLNLGFPVNKSSTSGPVCGIVMASQESYSWKPDPQQHGKH